MQFPLSNRTRAIIWKPNCFILCQTHESVLPIWYFTFFESQKAWNAFVHIVQVNKIDFRKQLLAVIFISVIPLIKCNSWYDKQSAWWWTGQGSLLVIELQRELEFDHIRVNMLSLSRSIPYSNAQSYVCMVIENVPWYTTFTKTAKHLRKLPRISVANRGGAAFHVKYCFLTARFVFVQ